MHKSVRPLYWSAMTAILLGSMSLTVSAQSQNYPAYPGQRTDAPKSRAEQEAEEKVAFSPEIIIAILRHEPGLLLEVKKMLVRKAYEQGRVLESSDLTDDEVFRLLREDEHIRVLATREIQDRAYIRAKPTQAEIERENALAAQYAAASGTQVSPLNLPSNQTLPSSAAAMSQEQQYWSIRDRQMSPYGVPNQLPSTNLPPQTPQEETPGPNNLSPENPQRQLKQASSQQDFYSTDQQTAMPRISPDQLSALLNTNPQSALALTGSSSNQIPAGVSPGMRPEMGAASLPDMGSSSNPVHSLPSGSSSATSDQNRYPVRQTSYSTDLNLDRPQIRQKPNPYADVPSLYDLYMQVSRRPATLQQFGMDVFRNGTGNTDELPLDLPVGPDYVLGPGDGLNIELWGAVSQRLQRLVDRAGLVALPEVGTVHVAGRTLGDVQRMVQSVLRTQFRDVAFDATDSNEFGVRHLRNDPGKRGFSAARRPGENH